MCGWIRFFQDRQERHGGGIGVAQLVTVHLLAGCPNRVHDLVVVGNAALDAGQRPTSPVGAEAAGLHDRDGDAERRDFVAQRPGQSFERVLRTVVGGDAGKGAEPTHRGHEHNPTAPPGAHRRQHSLGDGNRAEDIDVELLAEDFQRDFLEDPLDAIARVVHQHIDRTGQGFGLGNDGRDARGLGDVQQQSMGSAGGECFELGNLLGLAQGADHRVSGLQRGVGEGPPETRRDTAHEEHPGHMDPLRRLARQAGGRSSSTTLVAA